MGGLVPDPDALDVIDCDVAYFLDAVFVIQSLDQSVDNLADRNALRALLLELELWKFRIRLLCDCVLDLVERRLNRFDPARIPLFFGPDFMDTSSSIGDSMDLVIGKLRSALLHLDVPLSRNPQGVALLVALV